VKTQVRESGIPGAGNGRFAGQELPAKTLLCKKPYMPMSTIESLLAVPLDRAVIFESVDDLEKYISLSEKEGGYTRAQVLDLFENFGYCLDGKKICVNAVTYTWNHAEDAKDGRTFKLMEEIQSDGSKAAVAYTICNVSEGTEFLHNYRIDLQMAPTWYQRFCEANAFKDVRTKVLEAVAEASRKRKAPDS